MTYVLDHLPYARFLNLQTPGRERFDARRG